MRHPPLQAPLLWQTYLGFWIAGITAAPWPLPSLCFAVLLLFVDARLWRGARVCVAALCLLTGCMTGSWQLYGSLLPTAILPADGARQAAPAPSWLHEDAQQPRICGTVRDMQGLPDNRLRLLLDEVRLINSNAVVEIREVEAEAEALTDLLRAEQIRLARKLARLAERDYFATTPAANQEFIDHKEAA